MLFNQVSKGVALAILLGLGMLVDSSANAQTEETIAFWEFDGTNFLADSSGNGYDLTSIGNVTQVSDTASFTDGLLSVADLDLSPYRQVTVSWDMNYTGGTYLFEQTENFNHHVGAIAAFTDSLGIRCDSSYNMDNYTPTPGWHSYSAVYDLQTNDVADVVKIFEDDIEIGSARISSSTGKPIQDPPPASFQGTTFNIGARAEGYDPMVGDSLSFQGQIDNLMITGRLLPEPTPGLVAHYQFDGNLNNSVDGVAATAMGTTPEVMYVDGPEGIAGKAVDLSGSDWYINCGEYITTSSDNLTVSAWIYDNQEIPTTDHNYCRGIVSKDGFRGGDWALRRYSFIGSGYTLSGRAQMLVGPENDSYALSDEATVPSGQWVHLAATYETTETGSEIKLYIDGALATTTMLEEGVGTTSFNDILIGYDAANQTYFDGLIADVRVYNDTLDAAEILAIVTPEEKLAGDANGDGKVDGSDVTILAGNWQAGVDGSGGVTWDMGDFNGDGKVDGSDVTILAGNWQAGVTVATASVPEPGTIALLLCMFAAGLVVPQRATCCASRK